MKYKPPIIDLEVVKDWNWVKCEIRRGYYFIRNKWWGVTSFCRGLFSLNSLHWCLGFVMIASVVSIILMGVYIISHIFNIGFALFLLGFIIMNIWLDTKLPYKKHKKYKKYDNYYNNYYDNKSYEEKYYY